MDTSLNATNAWQRLRRQMLLEPAFAPAAVANADDFRKDAEASADAPETLPMLYRSEAFAEDLFESHPQAAW